MHPTCSQQFNSCSPRKAPTRVRRGFKGLETPTPPHQYYDTGELGGNALPVVADAPSWKHANDTSARVACLQRVCVGGCGGAHRMRVQQPSAQPQRVVKCAREMGTRLPVLTSRQLQLRHCTRHSGHNSKVCSSPRLCSLYFVAAHCSLRVFHHCHLCDGGGR